MKKKLVLRCLCAAMLIILVHGRVADAAGKSSISLSAGGLTSVGGENRNRSPELGFRVGYLLDKKVTGSEIGFETGIDYIPSSLSNFQGKTADYQFRFDMVYPMFVLDRLSPFLAIGAGVNYANGSSAGGISPLLSAGAGADYFLWDWLAATGNLRYVILIGDTASSSNLEFSLGLKFVFGGDEKPQKKLGLIKHPTVVALLKNTPPAKLPQPSPKPETASEAISSAQKPAASPPAAPAVPVAAPAEVAKVTPAPVPAAPAVVGKVVPAEAPTVTTPLPLPALTGKEAADPLAEAPVPAPAMPEKPEIPQVPVAPSAAPATVLDRIVFTTDAVLLGADGVIGRYRTFTLDKPARLVIDIARVRNGITANKIESSLPGISRARIAIHRNRVRVVLDSDQKAFPPYRVESTPAGLRVLITSTLPAEAEKK